MDPFDLDRFRTAQRDVYEVACAELRAGRKRGHWMWFVFPQMRGLGFSETARYYGMGSLAEAEAYLADAELGTRLVEAFEIVGGLDTGSARDIFGAPDDLKLRSCATLFASVAGGSPVFWRVLERYFEGAADDKTLALLKGGG